MSGAQTGVLVVVHGDYGRPLVAAAEGLVGALRLQVTHVTPGQGRAQLRRDLEREIAAQDRGEGVLVLTDLCGSTPANICAELLAERQGSELVTGLNLAMLLKLSTCDRAREARGLARELIASSQRSIIIGSALRAGTDGGSCGD